MRDIRFSNWCIFVFLLVLEVVIIASPLLMLLFLLKGAFTINLGQYSSIVSYVRIPLWAIVTFNVLWSFAEQVLENEKFLTEELNKELFTKLNLLLPWYKLFGVKKENPVKKNVGEFEKTS